MIRNLLNTQLGGWIERRGTIEWSPRSPNFTSIDFFLGGAMKDPVYNSKPRRLDDLKMAITTQFTAITQGFSKENVRRLLWICRDRKNI